MVNLDHRDQYEERVCVICVQALGLDPQISHLLRLPSRHREHRQLGRTPGRCFPRPAIGEPQRAFYSDRFSTEPLSVYNAVPLRVPERLERSTRTTRPAA